MRSNNNGWAVRTLALCFFCLMSVCAAVAQEVTAFRGLYLGQTKAEAERALSVIGMACQELSGPGSMYGEFHVTDMLISDREIFSQAEEAPCLYAPSDIASRPIGVAGLPPIVEYFFGILRFRDDSMFEMILIPQFFNVSDISPREFANAIVENYPTVDGLRSIDGRWVGSTPHNERLEVRTSRNGRNNSGLLGLIVTRSAVTGSPAFD